MASEGCRALIGPMGGLVSPCQLLPVVGEGGQALLALASNRWLCSKRKRKE